MNEDDAKRPHTSGTESLNEIAFELLTHSSGVREIVPFIDGTRLKDIISRFEEEAHYSSPGTYAGIVPDNFRFGPLVDHFLGDGEWNPGAPAVLGCECLEWGCWPLHARIEVTPDRVRWTSFEGPEADRVYGGLGPFVFNQVQYLRAVAEIEQALA